MRCLLCGRVFQDIEELNSHYITFHKVDPENRFYQKLISCKDNKCIFEKCLRCSEFLPTSNYKAKHKFLKHYNLGKEELFEDKPLEITENSHFIKYFIGVKKFSDSYDFHDSDKVVSDFLNNVRSKFKPSGSVLIKGSFVIENIQPAISEEFIPLADTRYWATDIYRATYFNDFVFYSLQNDFTKRVVNNGLTGSSWVFNRFINLELTVLKNLEYIFS